MMFVSHHHHEATGYEETSLTILIIKTESQPSSVVSSREANTMSWRPLLLARCPDFLSSITEHATRSNRIPIIIITHYPLPFHQCFTGCWRNVRSWTDLFFLFFFFNFKPWACSFRVSWHHFSSLGIHILWVCREWDSIPDHQRESRVLLINPKRPGD